MSDNYNEKQSILDKEEVQRIIDERIARLVESDKALLIVNLFINLKNK